ncbi:MAG: phosphate ABC transporter permease subunit PstC [Caldilineaceae bacterium]
MFRKAAMIQALFFSAAAFLVVSSVSLIAFVGSQGFTVFQTISPLEFFTGTTWNPNGAPDSEAVTTDSASETTASDGNTDTEGDNTGLGAQINDGQLIEPSEPTASSDEQNGQMEIGGQLIEPSEAMPGESSNDTSGQSLDSGQLIEPSEAMPDEGSSETGQAIQDGQLIEPSEPVEGSTSDGQPTMDGSVSTAAQVTDPSVTSESTPEGLFGILPLLVGSLLTALVTLLISAPLAILVAIFMVEIAPDPMRRLLRATVEIFAALPSVIFGLLGLVYVVPWVRETFQVGLGKGILAASVVLVFMTQPTIVTIAEDALRSLPMSLREAARGIGATRWQMIWGVLLPSARSGLFTAIILGMGRAIGETMAVQMVIGNITEYIPTNLVDGATTMPAAIVTQLPEAASPEHRAALIMVAFVLLVTSFVLITVARLSVRSPLSRS